MADRKTRLLAFILPISLLLGSEIGLGWARSAFVHATRWILEPPAVFGPGLTFAVGASTYEVDFWCTPAFLWAGTAILLHFSPLGFRRYWRALALILPLTALAMVANVVLSIVLHQRGIDWTWAHYPGLALIYAAVLLACLRRPVTAKTSPELPLNA